MTRPRAERPLFEGRDWTFDTIRRVHDAIEAVSRTELGLDIYPNRIEIITAEQMLDAYSSIGMPLFYKHWSFGKHFAQHEKMYSQGARALAYEIVINSDPCISYIMEENSATMQALVIAHAAFGHNTFFKTNYLYRQWTDAEGILQYLDFAKRYIAECEQRYGEQRVERVMDAAHALMSHGVHRYPRKRAPDLFSEDRRERERRQHGEKIYNDLWRTVPGSPKSKQADQDEARRRALLELPQENILYFIEKTAPNLAGWQRELVRIVRMIAQYFYPQSQTKVANEGCATYCHYQIMSRLHENGDIDDGSFLEFLTSHTNVVFQPEFDDPRFGGLNPYALGFAMMQDIERICVAPTDEDRYWFPDIAGCRDPYGTLRHAWANYRDESFIAQYLSPHLMRRLRLFQLTDAGDKADEIRVEAIHDERGYRQLRRSLARQYDGGHLDPNIQVVDVDLRGDRRLLLEHRILDGVALEPRDAQEVVQHLADLWGYQVCLREITASSGATAREYAAKGRGLF